jgi:hypothetical protein
LHVCMGHVRGAVRKQGNGRGGARKPLQFNGGD